MDNTFYSSLLHIYAKLERNTHLASDTPNESTGCLECGGHLSKVSEPSLYERIYESLEDTRRLPIIDGEAAISPDDCGTYIRQDTLLCCDICGEEFAAQGDADELIPFEDCVENVVEAFQDNFEHGEEE